MLRETSSPWLVGGPARCGKSALAEALSHAEIPLATLRVDALLHVYRKIRPLVGDDQKRDFLSSYLNRPRFMNPQRTETLRPINDFPLKMDQVLDGIAYPSSSTNPIRLIACAFDEMARLRGKDSWLVLDLHPELYFRSYKKSIPNLKLLILLRDPLEAVAASLYWRSFPKRRAQADRYLSYTLFLWCLSAITGAGLKSEFPNDVYILSSNDLFSGKSSLPADMIPGDCDLQMLFHDLFDGAAYFSFDNRQSRFLCPDGQWHNLLSDQEISYIEQYRMKMWAPQKLKGVYQDENWQSGSGLIGRLLLVARHNPSLAKQLADGLFFPVNVPRRIVGSMKTLLRGAIRR